MTEYCVVPHAGGNLPPYPVEVIADTVRDYGKKHKLVLLRDGEALFVDGSTAQLI